MTLALLQLKNINKKFGSNIALNGVHFSLEEGEIHSLLGENGAGKTTLMNILYGLYRPDSGEILLNGKRIHPKSPKDAINSKIGMIHQHFQIVPVFTVAENVVLGVQREGVGNALKRIMLDRLEAQKDVENLSGRFGLKVDPKALAQDLSVGAQQRVEILKALYRDAKILILDEPTAVLTPQEVEDLFDILEELKEDKRSIVFISHKLDEVMKISDRVTVLRGGQVIGTMKPQDTDRRKLARMMVGRETAQKITKKEVPRGDVVLEVADMKVLDKIGVPVVGGISLQVRSGEIFGIGGVDGNGQAEMAEALSGLRKIASGRMLIKGKEQTDWSVQKLIEHNGSHIPQDRRKMGLILGFSLLENLILETHGNLPYSKWGILKSRKIRDFALQAIRDFDIRAQGPNDSADSLSGGNQQKVVIARELSRKPDILIAVNPTRGLDIAAAQYVHSKLSEARERGSAVLLISTELDELLSLSDKVGIMFEGKLMGIVSPKTPRDEIGLMMMGEKRAA